MITPRQVVPGILKSCGVVALGVAIAVFSALYHSWVFPLGAIGSAFLVSLLAISVRTLFFSRSYLGLTSATIVVVLMFASGMSSNGSFLIVANSSGLLFLGLASVGLVVAFAWPRFPPRTTRYDKAIESSERTHQP